MELKKKIAALGVAALVSATSISAMAATGFTVYIGTISEEYSASNYTGYTINGEWNPNG